MSMYDSVMGDGAQGNRGAIVLAALGNPDVGRFRDAWIEKGENGEPVLAVYTRNGGGNRTCYCETSPCQEGCLRQINEALAGHPNYIRDADDEFDSTYATFYFSTPESLHEFAESVAQDPVSMSDKWQEAIDAIGKVGKRWNC